MTAEELIERYNAGERRFIKQELNGITIKDFTFENVCFYESSFENVYFQNVKFIKSNLSNVDFKCSKLIDVCFDKSLLVETNIIYSDLNRVSFKDSSINNTNFIKSKYSNIDIKKIIQLCGFYKYDFYLIISNDDIAYLNIDRYLNTVGDWIYGDLNKDGYLHNGECYIRDTNLYVIMTIKNWIIEEYEGKIKWHI